jgi:hypothetical protein
MNSICVLCASWLGARAVDSGSFSYFTICARNCDPATSLATNGGLQKEMEWQVASRHVGSDRLSTSGHGNSTFMIQYKDNYLGTEYGIQTNLEIY